MKKFISFSKTQIVCPRFGTNCRWHIITLRRLNHILYTDIWLQKEHSWLKPSFAVDHLIPLCNNANVYYETASIHARYPASKMRHLSHGEKVLLMEKYDRNILGRQRTEMSGTDHFVVSTGYLSRRQMTFAYANHMAYIKMCTFADRHTLRFQYSPGGTMAPT